MKKQRKEFTMAKTYSASQESRGTPQTSIIIGTILFIAGLIGILMRTDITVAIVGRGQVMQEAFFGGSSTSTALIAITTISAIAMISGLIIFVLGIIRANAKPNNNDHDSMFCPNCGTKLEGDNEFCPECGKPL